MPRCARGSTATKEYSLYVRGLLRPRENAGQLFIGSWGMNGAYHCRPPHPNPFGGRHAGTAEVWAVPAISPPSRDGGSLAFVAARVGGSTKFRRRSSRIERWKGAGPSRC